MKPLALPFALIALACSPREAEQPESPRRSERPAPGTVSLDEFRQLQWIAGKWRGSGGALPAFYEEYRVLDDSTIQMRAFPDSTFGSATDSSWIELRRGGVRSRGVNRTYMLVALGPDSVRFAPPDATLNGHTFARRSADEWTATLHASRAGGEPTVYTMHRINR